MPDRPTGTVTFLFTDIEGSTALWEQRPGPSEVPWSGMMRLSSRSLSPQRKNSSPRVERLAMGSVSAITNVDTALARKTGL
jgi:hypothetical protein